MEKRRDHEQMATETAVVWPPPGAGRGKKDPPDPRAFRESAALPAPRAPTCSLQNWERQLSVVLSRPVCGPLSQPPQDTETSPNTHTCGSFLVWFLKEPTHTCRPPPGLGSLGWWGQDSRPRRLGNCVTLGGHSIPKASRCPSANMELDCGSGSSVGQPRGHWR